MVKDSQLIFVSSVPDTTYANGDTISWNYSNLLPNEERVINITLHIPYTVNPGYPLSSMAILEPLAPNYNLTNNYAYVKDTARSSCDPNDKTSLFGSDITLSQVADGQYLTYIIRFQNTGSDTAFKVVIRDTLDSNLDVSTFDVLSASNNYSVVITGNELVNFTFNNILLPDSGINEPASIGYIVYRIKPESGVPAGAVIKNTAYIYFDYNMPVATNTSIVNIPFPVSVSKSPASSLGFWLMPNPTVNKLVTHSSHFHDKAIAISIMDVLGKAILSLISPNLETGEASIDVSKFSSGIYFLQLKSESGCALRKFVKE